MWESEGGESWEVLRADVAGRFGAERFGVRHFPVSGGLLAVSREEFGRRLPACLDMLIKIPGERGLRLGLPYANHPGVMAFLARCLEMEGELLGEGVMEYYAYLTVDNRLVRAGKTHRNAGWHFDGMQGTRYPQKLRACHQYVVADCLATEFACGPKDANGLDEARDNWFYELSKQVGPEEELYRPQALEVVAMSCYQLHRSVVADIDQWRMFLRLDFSLKQQDRLGNSPNPVLPAPWEFVVREMPAHLRIGVDDTGWGVGVGEKAGGN